MKKIWLVAANTYRQRIRSSSFLILTFALPILMVIAAAVPFIINRGDGALHEIGYVDQAGGLTFPAQVSVDDETLHFRAFSDRAAAHEAYQKGGIGGYLLFPAGYFAGEQVRYYAEEAPSAELVAGLHMFIQSSLMPGAPDWVLERLANPSEQTFVALNSGESVSAGPGLILRLAAPAGLAILLALALLFSSSQMGAAVVREKEQRAMEIIITSLTPRQLVAGKVMGVSLLSLTQLAIWGLGLLVGLGLLLAREIDLAALSVPWNAILWGLLLAVPGYFLFAVIASGLGIIAGDTQQAQQLAGILGMLSVIPLWFAGVLVAAPNGTAAVALTLFPLTGPVVALLRMALTEVPAWQLLASLVFLLISLWAAMWLVARILRMAILMVGQKAGPRQIVRMIRQA